MSIVLDTRLSVNTWNAVKFIVFQFVISLFFARLWESFVRNRAHRIISNDHVATLFTSGLGRLTPAQLMVCHSRDPGTFRLSHFVPSKVLLLLVNAVLLLSLLLAEYGSTSTPVFQKQLGNVTTVTRHKDLVRSLLAKERNVSELYPMKLSPGDYIYGEARSRIELFARVRNSSSNEFLRTKSANPQLVVKLCGMLAPSCENTLEQAKPATFSGVYEVADREMLENVFTRPNAVPGDVFISTSIKLIGWLDSKTGRYIPLNKTEQLTNISCTLQEFATFLDNSSSQLLQCAIESGEYILFLSFQKPKNKVFTNLYKARPSLRNRTGVLYSISELFESSLFGVEKGSVPSRTVALWQTLHYPNILRSLGDKDLPLLQTLKEQNVWAILGMVSGNSAAEQVITETESVNAAVDELFVIGFGMIMFICLLLIVFICAERCRGKPSFHVPVADAEVLAQIRQLGNCTQHSGEKKLKSVDFRKVRNEDNAEYLSFTGTRPDHSRNNRTQ